MTPRKKLLLEIALNIMAVTLLLLLVHFRDKVTVGQMQSRVAAIAETKRIAEIADRNLLPSARIDINRSSDTGWNVVLTTENFGFATDPDNQRYAAKGFVHLFIDGRSAAKLDSPFHFIPTLSNGDHLITILFEDRNGQAFGHGGKAVTQSVKLSIAGLRHETTLP
jgi:hypothetical protein